MSRLFQLGDDTFGYLLSWFTLRSIINLDIAVGNRAERSYWLFSLQTIDNENIDEYEHTNPSIRWLILRGARTTTI